MDNLNFAGSYFGFKKNGYCIYHFIEKIQACVKVKVGKDGTINIRGNQNVKKRLTPYLETLRNEFKKSQNLDNLLILINQFFDYQEPSHQSFTSFQLQFIVQQLSNLPQDSINKIEPCFSEVHLQHKDPRSRIHLLKLKILNEKNENINWKIYDLDLPFNPDDLLEKQNNEFSLTLLFSTFQSKISSLQIIWSFLFDLDLNSNVLDPVNSSFKHLHRKIYISSGKNIAVIFDPFQPELIPKFNFYGDECFIEQMERNLKKKSYLWSCDKNIIENIEDILTLTIPNRKSQVLKEEESEIIECGLCFERVIREDEEEEREDEEKEEEGEEPDINCTNEDCPYFYHKFCLIEWLKCQSCTKYSYGVMFGKCPNCSQAISTNL